MTYTHKSLGVLTAALMLSACKEEEPNHTVQYFLDNADARAEMMAECEVMDDAISDANCRNASAAAQTVAREENRKNRSDAVKSLYGDGS
ncbi:EexN family lipoprotein [Ruegeria sp. EL01]|uniref:EexN family lipoprotein n=1 Tax=Ruegeria sp. EL01 TaxID=2107578 RepID=UPI001C1F8A2F|nr:EexN family lipoprotein [Ruegeria sp. EL01]